MDRCIDCKWWEQNANRAMNGFCLFNPPIAVLDRQNRALTLWPLTPANRGCSRFAPHPSPKKVDERREAAKAYLRSQRQMTRSDSAQADLPLSE